MTAQTGRFGVPAGRKSGIRRPTGALHGAWALLLAAMIAIQLTGGAALAQAPKPGGNGEPTPAERVEAWDKTAAAVESLLEKPDPTQESLSLMRQEVERQRAEAAALVSSLSAAIPPLEAQVSALGPKPEEGVAEPTEMAERRAALETQLAQARARLGEVQLAATRAAGLVQRLAEVQRLQFAERLFSRGPSLTDVETWASASRTALDMAARLTDGVVSAIVGLEPTGRHALVLFAGVAAFLFFVFAYAWLRARVEAMILSRPASTRQRRHLAVGLALAVARAAPPAAAAIVLAALIEHSGLLSATGALLVWRAAEGVALVVAARAIARLFFAPRTPEARIVDLGPEARPATRSATWFFGFVAIDRLLIDVISAAGGSLALLTIVHVATAIVAGPTLHGFVRRVRPPKTTSQSAPPGAPAAADTEGEQDADSQARPDREVLDSAGALVRLIALLVSASIPIAAVLGYFALSRYLLAGSAMTLGLVAVLALVYVMATRFLTITRPDGTERRGLAPVLVGMALAIAAAPALAAIWGASREDLQGALARLLEGVQVGDLRLTLSDLLAAMAIAVIGFWITRFVQGLLRRAVLPQTRLDSGIQTSVTTGVGYIGALLTMLIAVSAIGLDLSNLAIVAGALSVGIGFGLQAIVSNFVSGIILLIERPIRVGDWIAVGGAEGHVQRINVRSTEIETFDRQSVIVPNSELISNHVINYTHRNLTGRVICAVGVAYDADPDQVIDILREAAKGHPQVLRYPQPSVAFRGFGDSSLNFELRAYVRDVNWKLSITSDLNLAILKGLRAAAIEIPYPQRDLHLRSGFPNGAADVAKPEPGRVEEDPAEEDGAGDDGAREERLEEDRAEPEPAEPDRRS